MAQSRKIDLYAGTFAQANVKIANALKEKFSSWLDNYKSGKSFGKYGNFDRPDECHAVGLKKVHLITESEHLVFQKAKTPIRQRTSNSYLVYAENPNDPSHFLLICVIDPAAHERCRELYFMETLIAIAKAHFKLP